jgi:hypothetical protein
MMGLRRGLLFLIRCYQAFLSPLMPLGCKFHPTCSHYAVEAIERHGARHGASLAMRRILRCRPFSFGGYDPVPQELPSPGDNPSCHFQPERAQ